MLAAVLPELRAVGCLGTFFLGDLSRGKGGAFGEVGAQEVVVEGV